MWPFKPKVESLLRKGDVVGLIKVSRHASAATRLKAVAALAGMGSDEAFEALVWRLGDTNEQVRTAAAVALRANTPADGVGKLTAVAALTVDDDEALREREQVWRGDPIRMGNGVLALLGEAGGPAAAAFLTDIVTGKYPRLDRDLAGSVLAEMSGLDAARTIVEALEADTDSIGLDKDSADEHRLALVARVCGREAAEAHHERGPDHGKAFDEELVPRAVAVLERLVLRPNVAGAAVDALGRIATDEAVRVLGSTVVGEALTALPNGDYLRGRALAALVEAREQAADSVGEAINRQLARVLRLTGIQMSSLRQDACDALADWAPDNAEDHAWILAAKGLYREAAELGTDAVTPLAATVRDESPDARRQALGALTGMDSDAALEAIRGMVDDPELNDDTRTALRRALDRAEAQTHAAALRSSSLATRRQAAKWLDTHDMAPEPGSEDEAYFLVARGDWAAAVERGDAAAEALRLAAADEPLEAAVALARLGNDLACDWLGPILREAGADQVKAMDALVELGTERAAITVASVLGKASDPEPIRSALVAIGTPAVTALRPALEANDLALNRLAARVVRDIGAEPDDPAQAAVLAVAAGDWQGAAEAGPVAAEPLRRFLERAARQHAPYELLTDVAAALAVAAPLEDVLADIDDESRAIQIRLPLAAGLARSGESVGVDRLVQWLFASPRDCSGPPLPWLAQLLDGLADRMGLTADAARDLVAAAAYVAAPHLVGDDAVGIRADTSDGAEAVARLAQCPETAAINVLCLVAEMQDAEVETRRPGYSDPVMLTLDFTARRDLARKRLRDLGKPPYDPHGYFTTVEP